MVSGFDFPSNPSIEWIGLREHFQEKNIFNMGKPYGFQSRFSLPIQALRFRGSSTPPGFPQGLLMMAV